MSGTASTPPKAPKAMSSKLLTMKFMQRTAASSPASAPSTPDQPSPKPQRNGKSSPENANIDSLADNRAIQAALAEEEAKRQIALDRQAADAGDTHWVLHFKPDIKNSHAQSKTILRVVETGFAAIDHALTEQITSAYDEDLSSDRPFIVGRRSFGKFNRMVERIQEPSIEDSSDSKSDSDDQSEDESEESEDNDPDGTNALIKAAQEVAAAKLKAERKAKRKEEKAELLRLAEKRKKRDVKLNTLTSISGTGSQGGCFRCGQVGHFIADCPKRARGRDEDEVDRPRKLRR